MAQRGTLAIDLPAPVGSDGFNSQALSRSVPWREAPCGQTESGDKPGSRRQRDLSACVAWLLDSAGNNAPVEKRVHRRFPYRKPISVTPINNATGRPDSARCFPAFGIDISSTGICLLARQLVPARNAVLSLEGPGQKSVSLLFEPRWVRFTRGGWYQTGGKLLEVLQEDVAPFPAFRLLEPPPELEALCEKSRHF